MVNPVAKKIQTAVKTVCSEAQDYSHIVNGRFKGGWTTRQYGQPKKGVHAIQMELAQSTYMSESAPWDYDQIKADETRQYLQTILQKLQSILDS